QGSARLRTGIRKLCELRGDVTGGALDVLLARTPQVGYSGKNALEARSPLPILRRKIGAAKKWFQVGREENVGWPAGAPRRSLQERYVGSVHIWPLFSIHLHRDEPLVQQRSDSRIGV